MTNLKSKAVSGVKWNTLYSAITAIGGPITLIILARLLTTEEFGVIAVVMIIMSTSRKIARMGFSQAIVQKDKIEEGDLSSVFWFEQLIGIIAFLIVFFGAGTIANFFNIETVVLIRLSGTVFLIEPIDLVFRAWLKRELKFNFLNKARLTRFFFKETSTIGLAFMGYGAMSVVIGHLLGIIVLTVILFMIFYRRKIWLPRVHFSLKQLKPYLRFGIFVTGNAIFGNIIYKTDEIIIGSVLGPTPLGLYYFAKRIIRSLISLIRSPISNVAFPLFSKISKSEERLRRLYIRVVKLLGSVSIPACVGVALTAPLFVPLIFGNEWIPAIPVIVIMSIFGIGYSLFGAVFTVLYSLGRSDLNFYGVAIELPIRVALIYLASLYGVLHIALTISIFMIAKFLIFQYLLKYLIHLKILSLGLSLKYILACSIVMGTSLYILRTLIEFGDVINLVLMILIGIIIYGLSMFTLERNFVRSSINMVKGDSY